MNIPANPNYPGMTSAPVQIADLIAESTKTKQHRPRVETVLEQPGFAALKVALLVLHLLFASCFLQIDKLLKSLKPDGLCRQADYDLGIPL
jgi:hypothetical protein